MKIAILTPDYPPVAIGGCSTSARLLAETLRKDHQVDVFVFTVGAETIKEDSGTIFFHPGKPKILFFHTWLIFRALWSALKTYDVIHVYNVTPVLAVQLLKLFGRIPKEVKIIMTLNNHNGAIASRIVYFRQWLQKGFAYREPFFQSLSNPEVPFGIFGAWIRRMEVSMIRWAGRRADYYIALTQQIQDDYVAQGYNSHCFTIIPNMLDSAIQLQEHVQKNNRIQVIIVGQLSPLKGQRELLSAYLALPESVQKKVSLHIVGGGKIEPLLRQMMSTASKSADIQLYSVDYSELSNVYAVTDVVVHLSRFPEPFSRVWLEAMSYGIPVLASRTGSGEEVLGPAAVYCDPFSQESIQNALQELINDSQLRSQLSTAASIRIQEYLPEKVQARMRLFYANLV